MERQHLHDHDPHMIQRSITTIPGYDCRTVCLHKPKGKHGIHNDEWLYVVKDMDAHCALELTISTNIFPDTVETHHVSRNPSRTHTGMNLSRHFAHPTDRDQVLSVPEPCAYIGKCYVATWGLRADTFAKNHFISAHGREQQELFWRAFESDLREEIAVCHAARLVDGDLKWKVCVCCAGERVVPV